MPRINTNIQSMLVTTALHKNERSMSGTLEKLSTGLKINRSSDDAAGLSVSEQLRGQINGLGIGNRNIQDGMSVLNIAEGALNEIGDMLQRLRELAIQSANGILGDKERDYIQTEVKELCDEIDRTANTTKYNGQALLNGDKGTPARPNPWGRGEAYLHVGPNTDSLNDLLVIKLRPANCESFGLRDTTFDGSTYIDYSDPDYPAGREKYTGQLLDMSTAAGAQAGIGMLTTAIEEINSLRAQLGAQTNRLESTLTNQRNMLLNVTAAESTIRDTDFAVETMNFTRLQVLMQSSTSMLSQANQLPSNILSLMNNI
jgi:flagellin